MRRLLAIAFSIVLIAAAVVLLARFADGPLGPLQGGPLRSGTIVETPPGDWTFATGVAEVELQLVDPPRSRTTWILVQDGRAYIPCAFAHMRLWKQWPRQALADGRAIVRIDGRRHRVLLTRVEDPILVLELFEGLAGKYPSTADVEDEVWFFRLDPAA